ncbi:golgin subfamily A member 1-like isoform X2 [Dysidea avara]|uniref:golgin subfamily A member 1-like isoform X2 n=1 Tax=Dysidea avara TaxID=196820 RepID=UPI0033333F8C
MFKKLKKRLEVDEGQPPIPVSKPGTAVRSSINNTSPVRVESPQDKGTPVNNLERGKDGKLDTSISLDDYNIVSSQEMRELARAENRTDSRAESASCASCAKLEACLEKTQDTMATRLKEQSEAFKVKEEEANQLLMEKDNELTELRGTVESLEAKITAMPKEPATPTNGEGGQAYSLLTKKLISTEIDCIEAKSKLSALEDELKMKNAKMKEKDNEISVLRKQSAYDNQQLEQLRQEMAGLQPLFSPSAPQDSDLWKLQVELQNSKKTEEDLRSQLEERQQTMTQETEDLRTQCQQLASQLTSMKQSNSRMLLEHEKMTLMVSNIKEEKATILDSNIEVNDKILTLEATHAQQIKDKNEFVAGLENSICNLHVQVNTLTKEKESIQNKFEITLQEKDILIASLQEDLENATNREMTQMSGHEEAAAILPLHYSTSTNYDDDEDDDDGNLQEMCQFTKRGSFEMSTSFNHDHDPATLQPVDLTVEFQHLQRKVGELEETISKKNKVLRVHQQTITDLRKQLQKEMKTKGDNKPSSSDQTEVSSESLKSDIHQIKFQYLKNTILKYMCSDVEETQHMIKAIGTLLSFSPEEFQYVQKSIDYKVCT